MRPSPAEYSAYFERYISLVTETDILGALAGQVDTVQSALRSLSDERAGFRYAPGKWSVREVLGHIIDTERVFGYRAMCIARGEAASLPGFDENRYEAAAEHDRYTLTELVDEFSALRCSHVLMFRRLDTAAWERIGRANENPASPRALAFLMVGHVRHHGNILTQRYGVPF